MRRASFMHTQEQMRIGAAAARASADGYAGFVPGGKDVTRRLAWSWAEPGMYLLAVSKGMGLAAGERAEIFGVIEILEAQREPLYECTPDEARREGFPLMTGVDFVDMFCAHMHCVPTTRPMRVVFRHVDVRRIVRAAAALSPLQRAMMMEAA